MKIYLAGPISGKSFEEVIRRYTEKQAILKDFGYEVLSPMTAKGNLKGVENFASSGYTNHPVSNDHSIFNRDKWMVTQADIVLADLSNATTVSIGTMMEIAWANYLNKQVIVVVPDGQDHPHPHRHAFVYEAATIILHDMEDAYDYLKALAEGEVG